MARLLIIGALDGELGTAARVAIARGARLAAIAFRAVNGALGALLLRGDGAPVHLAGRLKRDSYRGADRVQFQIEDAAAI